MTGEPKLSVQGLYKVFGPHPERVLERLAAGTTKEEILADTGNTVAVDDVSFDVAAGETFVVMGLSGSGKSTLARCLNRLVTPTRGKVLLAGVDVGTMDNRELRELRRSKVAMVFQHFALLPHRKVLDNVVYGLEVQRVPRAERERRSQEALELVGLAGWGAKYPEELSGGMQQRVGLARALATDPDVLLMDEPFSALDPLIRREMQEELIDLQGRLRKTLVFITHDLDEALKLGDRMAIMRDGRFVQVGRPQDILREPADEYVASFVQDVDPSRVLLARDIMVPPGEVVRGGHAPDVALRMMERAGVSELFVVESDNRLLGLVTSWAALAARAEQLDALRELPLEAPITAAPDTPMRELVAVAADHAHPIAVTDGDRRLLGVIADTSILRALVTPDVSSKRHLSSLSVEVPTTGVG